MSSNESKLAGEEVGTEGVTQTINESKYSEVAKLLEKARISNKSDAESKMIANDFHDFWDSQPVPKFSDPPSMESGPIEVKTLEMVRKEPFQLPEGFEWSVCDLKDPLILDEIYQLLTEHYVEDDDHMFRFDYSKEFLHWALLAPNYKLDWHLGVRGKLGKKKLFAFITGIPIHMNVDKTKFDAAEINFLCVHKKLRSKRLAPVLIKEITRRINLCNIWQAVYTAGVRIPTPVSECKYFHRPIDIKKLIEVRFSHLSPRMTLSRAIKLHQTKTMISEDNDYVIRKMESKDVSQIQKLLSTRLEQFRFHPYLTNDEIKHWLLSRDNVVCTYVFLKKNVVTDFVSFYILPSTVLHSNHPEYKAVNAAYHFYSCNTTLSLKELLNEAVVFAKNEKCDVYNILNHMDHDEEILKEIKFGRGDGSLHYYLYNWTAPVMDHKDIGMILL